MYYWLVLKKNELSWFCYPYVIAVEKLKMAKRVGAGRPTIALAKTPQKFRRWTPEIDKMSIYALEDYIADWEARKDVFEPVTP